MRRRPQTDATNSWVHTFVSCMAGSVAALTSLANDAFIGSIQASTRSFCARIVLHVLFWYFSALMRHSSSHSLGS